MRTRSISMAAAIVASASSIVVLGACASHESTAEGSSDVAPNTIPTADGGAETSLDDGSLPEEPCTPDAVCPMGPFDPGTPGGAFDLRTRINVIRGRSASDVWAAGARGAIAHFDGTSWRRSNTGTTESMNGLWLGDSGEVAYRSLFSIFSRGLGNGQDAGPPSADGWIANGAATTPPELRQDSRFTSVWAPPGAEWLWCTSLEVPGLLGDTDASGLWRLRRHASTGAFEVENALGPGTCTALGCRQMTSIHGVSADDLWAVGYTGAVVHIAGAQGDAPSITPFDSQTWAGLHGVWVASATEAWAVGGAGVIRHYTGQPYTWDVVPDVPATEDLRAVWATSSTNIWAVGDGAVVLHYDGTSWSRVKVAGLGGRRPDLYSVWTGAPGQVWIGGDGVMLSVGGKP